MSFVHESVNEMSKVYLATERRYNYTTPKTFLEQIKLYQNLLAKKRRELIAKIERLENGLMKLQSTASQVSCRPLPRTRGLAEPEAWAGLGCMRSADTGVGGRAGPSRPCPTALR